MSISPSQTIGPFFNFALTVDARLGYIAGHGERITLRLRLLDGDGAPVPDGMLELWQADANGVYPHAEDPRHTECDRAFTGFARLETDQNGTCLFETIRPGRVGGQASHVNVTVFARGLLGHLTTRVYFEGDPSLETDPILALIPAARRHTLIARQSAESQWSLDIHMQGDHETVFFEL